MRAQVMVLGLLLIASSARADVVGPPPASCPAGAYGTSAHTGPYCAPATCSTDSDCTIGHTCRAASLCIALQACGGMSDASTLPDGGFTPCTIDTVTALCPSGAVCASGMCQTRRVCVADAAPANTSGCACALGSRGREAGAGIVVAMVAISLAARRWRASKRRRA